MSLSAFNFDAFNESNVPLVSIGSILFVISDTFIFWNRFILPLPYSRILVLVTYYSAQACIIIGTMIALEKLDPSKLSLQLAIG